MTMYMLTAVQMVEILGVYLLVTVGLPAFVFGRKLKSHRRIERFLFYYMTGNFYVMNLVFLLQLLKISCFVTLVLFTVVPTVWAWSKLNDIQIRQIVEKLLDNLKRISKGYLGMKTVRYRIYRSIKQGTGRGIRCVCGFVFRRPLECILLLLFFGILFRNYGMNFLQEYGYKASDMPVHNYWINEMSNNNIFAAGVYPYGFHCVIYYMHAVFGFATFNILRIFGFIQCAMVHLMLLCFLKLCCRTKYAPYIGILLYCGSDYLMGDTYLRFYSAIPQEYGMLFILPAIWFGFAYFEVRRKELREKEGKKESGLYLAGFAMSFSMTLAIHFYGTMIAGLFCLAMVIGYCFRFFHKKYFFQVVGTCALSVMIAVLPMALAFLLGTPLEGSLRWGMSRMGGVEQAESADEGQQQISVNSISESSNAQSDISGSGFTQNSDVESGISENVTLKGGSATGNVTGSGTNQAFTQESVPVQEPSLGEKISLSVTKGKAFWEKWKKDVCGAQQLYVLRFLDEKFIYRIIDGFFMLMILGIIFILFRQSDYGAMLISAGIYMCLMGTMLAAHILGIPALMDGSRASIYFAYSLPIVFSLLADALLVLVFLPVKKYKLPMHLMHLLSFGGVILVIFAVYRQEHIREPRNPAGQEMNEAIVCLENIIKNEKDFTWTIVSANDETQMGIDYGYHYETITFLEDMEGRKVQDIIRIPTQTVYIFIEKIPLDYYLPYENSGQTVSEKGALYPLPRNDGISMYKGEDRWKVMSRIYYWAQEFKRMYPNEMETYLETERFVCYRIEQNPYRLYDFSIDYGYNTWGLTEEMENGIQ